MKIESLTLWFRDSLGRNIWALISRSIQLIAVARVRVIIDIILLRASPKPTPYYKQKIKQSRVE